MENTILYNPVYLLTTDQKDSLIGKEFMPGCFFNPIQDLNDLWIITPQEINNCTNPEFIWVKELPAIEYFPKPLLPLV